MHFVKMHPVKMVVTAFLMWPVAEIAAFIFVAALMGVSTALILLILISFAGLLVLRQVGGDAMTRLRDAAGTTRIAGVTLNGAGMATGLGGILLVIPGFISGLLGVIVVFPTSRRWLLAGCRRLFSGDHRPVAPEIIELAPTEWQPLSHPELPPSENRPERQPERLAASQNPRRLRR